MKLQTLSLAPLATAGIFLGYLADLQAGEVAPMPSYVPTSDCDACNDPGMYGGVSLLYLKPYGDDGAGSGDDGAGSGGDWDFGARATLGFERPDGLFFELNGFWADGSYDVGNDSGSNYQYSQDQSAWYVEALVGDNLHCGEMCVDYGFGVRYGNIENEYGEVYSGNQDFVRHQKDSYSFEGIGPVVRIDVTRELNDRVSLYGGLSQAILFGDQDYDFRTTNVAVPGAVTPPPSNSGFGDSREELAFISEIEFGLQFNLDVAGLQGTHIKLGVEGSYWTVDDWSRGFVGGVLGAGFNF